VELIISHCKSSACYEMLQTSLDLGGYLGINSEKEYGNNNKKKKKSEGTKVPVSQQTIIYISMEIE